MEKFSELLIRHGSTKLHRHSYEYIYDPLFSSYARNAEIDILESGVEYGGGLAALKSYFPNARITGVDPVDSRKEENKLPGLEFILGDIKEYVPDRKFDIIIEDGNHSNNDALWAISTLPHHLKVGGTLVIEDVQEGYIVPVLSWGKLGGPYVVNTVDLRRLTNTHDNFLITVQRVG